MYQHLILDRGDERQGIATLTFNRPYVHNALSNAMVEELESAMSALESDSQLRVLILTGTGDKAFMAGADVRELEARDQILGREHTRRRQQLFGRIQDLNAPTIAAVNGYCLGAGLELAISCTLRVAANVAKFGCPEVNLGVIPGAGATQCLPRLVGWSRALEMILTGEPIDAAEAYRIGLVNRVVPVAQLNEAVSELATKLAAKSPAALRLAKDAVNRSLTMGLTEGLAYESCLHALACGLPDKQEGVRAFLEKRKPDFSGKRGNGA